MLRILAATDFSPRAEIALSRAAMLAQLNQARLSLVHVVDPDRPRSLVETEIAIGRDLLARLTAELGSKHDIEVDAHLYEHEAFLGICKAVEELQPALLVLGAYRRRLLQDVFVGTTAERSIRRSRKPVLVVNRAPHHHYAHVLAAVDLTQHSTLALGTLKQLGLNREAITSVVHLYDAPAFGSLAMPSPSRKEIAAYLGQENARAEQELDDFLHKAAIGRVQRIVRHAERSIAAEVETVAAELGADLLVIGAGTHSGSARMVLGSTTLEVLRTSPRDLLVVPEQQAR